MVRESNLIDISKITKDNYITYNEKLKFEVPRQWHVHNQKSKQKSKRNGGIK